MERSNLLAIDDALLRAGGFLALLWLAGAAAWLAVALPDPPLSQAFPILASVSAPLGLLVAGFRLRRREQRAWALRRLIDEQLEIRAADLLGGSDFTGASLDRAIRDLNNAGEALLVWDRQTGWIQDGRLRRLSVQVDECSSCHAKVSVSLAIGAIEAARCPYCGDPLAADRLLEDKARVIDALKDELCPRVTQREPAKRFSVPLFALLAVACWPLAIAYALWHWRAGERG